MNHYIKSNLTFTGSLSALSRLSSITVSGRIQGVITCLSRSSLSYLVVLCLLLALRGRPSLSYPNGAPFEILLNLFFVKLFLTLPSSLLHSDQTNSQFILPVQCDFCPSVSLHTKINGIKVRGMFQSCLHLSRSKMETLSYC